MPVGTQGKVYVPSMQVYFPLTKAYLSAVRDPRDMVYFPILARRSPLLFLREDLVVCSHAITFAQTHAEGLRQPIVVQHYCTFTNRHRALALMWAFCLSLSRASRASRLHQRSSRLRTLSQAEQVAISRKEMMHQDKPSLHIS